ncbi:MAG: hypothetical protein ABIH46_13630, partial [Chloroflexota bacterium]
WNHVSYQINTGERGDIAVMWARALGIKYFVVSYPGSADAYQDYAYPRKFEGLLAKEYDDRGMAIFQVPLKQPGPIKAVDLSAYNRLLPIKDAVDFENLSRYAEVVEAAPSILDYKRVSASHLEFEANLSSPEQGVLVRITHHPGWAAHCNGRSVPIRQDLAGFILIEPQQQGRCQFVLQHGLLWDQWLGYFLTVVTIVVLILWRNRRLREYLSKPDTQALGEDGQTAQTHEQT